MTTTLAALMVLTGAEALLVGSLIGSVLLPPTLAYLGGLGFHLAAATSV